VGDHRLGDQNLLVIVERQELAGRAERISPWIPCSICHSTKSRNAAASTSPDGVNGVIMTV
jgi:hypothetical protein